MTRALSPLPEASCNGSIAVSTIVRSDGWSSTVPQAEQNPEFGGFRCPHWLQKTYDIAFTVVLAPLGPSARYEALLVYTEYRQSNS